jgi:hypothetical protein
MVAQGVWRFAVVVMLMLACLLGASASDAKAEEVPTKGRPMEWIQEFPEMTEILEMAIGLFAAMAIGIPMFYMKRKAAMRAATGKMD